MEISEFVPLTRLVRYSHYKTSRYLMMGKNKHNKDTKNKIFLIGVLLIQDKCNPNIKLKTLR